MPPQPAFAHHLLSLVDGFEIKMSHTYDVAIFQASQSYVDGVNFYLKDLLMILLALQLTPCLVSPQPQLSCPRAGPPPPSLIHMVELGFVGLLNNPKRIFAQLQKL